VGRRLLRLEGQPLRLGWWPLGSRASTWRCLSSGTLDVCACATQLCLDCWLLAMIFDAHRCTQREQEYSNSKGRSNQLRLYTRKFLLGLMIVPMLVSGPNALRAQDQQPDFQQRLQQMREASQKNAEQLHKYETDEAHSLQILSRWNCDQDPCRSRSAVASTSAWRTDHARR
jgi:hypothetical protein